MNNTVSNLASYCANCGHIEPINLDDFHKSDCTIGLVYVHDDKCMVMDNAMAHDMFIALWNAETHMRDNDALLRRASESLTEAMQPFIDEYLNESSHYVLCKKSRLN